MRSTHTSRSDRVHRSWGVQEQKIVAASQSWCCAHCACSLPASFELDHRIALWAGGEDNCETNAQALCPSCHASKTQRESIERRNLRRAKREAAVRVAQEAARQEAENEANASKSRQPPSRDPAPGPSPEEREQILLCENPFLEFAFIPPTGRVRSWW